MLRALKDRVVLKRLDEPETGLIITPDIAKRKSTRCEVINVGEGASVEPGQKVIISMYSGTEVKIDGRDLVVVKDEDILAVLED